MIQNTILVLICNFFLLLVLQQFFKDFLRKIPEHKYLRWGLSALWFAGVFTVSIVINQPLVNFLVNLILMFLSFFVKYALSKSNSLIIFISLPLLFS